MPIYRVDADQAFDALRRVTQQADVEVRVLATHLPTESRARDGGATLPPRAPSIGSSRDACARDDRRSTSPSPVSADRKHSHLLSSASATSTSTT